MQARKAWAKEDSQGWSWRRGGVLSSRLGRFPALGTQPWGPEESKFQPGHNPGAWPEGLVQPKDPLAGISEIPFGSRIQLGSLNKEIPVEAPDLERGKENEVLPGCSPTALDPDSNEIP